jgi:hypothetical protein
MVFVWLTLVVALVHLAALMGLPNALAIFQNDAAQTTGSFTTHTIAPEPVPEPVVAKPPRAKPLAAPPVQPPTPAPMQEPSPTANEAVPTGTQETTQPEPTAAIPVIAASGAPVAEVANTDAAPSDLPPKLVIPPSVRLLYDVNGVVTFAYTGGSELLWLNQGDLYSARLQITKFGFNLRTWTSKGDISWKGLEPLRFGDQTRSELAAHFQRDKGIVSFSNKSPDVPLLPGAQDYLSSFFQLAGLLAGEPQRYPPGSTIAFQVVNARGAEPWVFKVDGPETIELPDGSKGGIKLTREHDAQYDTKVELWLSPDLAYVPIRIRLSQGNGDFAELLWRSAQKPD